MFFANLKKIFVSFIFSKIFPDLGGTDPVAGGWLRVGAVVGEVAVAVEGAALVKVV